MTSSIQKIRVGVIGAGDIVRTRHLPGLKKKPAVELVAVANRSLDSSRRAAAELGFRDACSDWRALIARDDIDAVLIGTWPYTHAEMSMAALETGKHVFCQARMAMNVTEAHQMVDAARRHPHLVNMLCPPPTRMPFEPFVRQVIAEGRLGQIIAVHLVSASGSNLNPGPIHWRERVEFSGRQILAMGIFAETLNAWLGPYRTLSAELATPLSAKTDEHGRQVEVRVPQVVSISGKLENGAPASETHLGLAADRSTPINALTIWGTAGTLRYTFGDTIELAAAGQPLQPVDVPEHLKRDWLVESDFIHAVRGAMTNGAPQRPEGCVNPDFAEGLLYMQKVEAVHLAAERGQAVTPAAL